ncbi:uncharacterized protein HaLaN_08026, partial [Haematococcus lacustris]
MDDDEHELTWLGEDTKPVELSAEEQLQRLQQELQQCRREMSEVRKELAAKAGDKDTVQLLRKDAEAHQKAPSVQAAESQALAEKEQHLQLLTAQVQVLEATLLQRAEELEESRKVMAAQKRALHNAAAQQ